MELNIKTILKYATIAAASVIVVKSAGSLLNAKTAKEGLMDGLSVMVGISAIAYSMQSATIVVKEK